MGLDDEKIKRPERAIERPSEIDVRTLSDNDLGNEIEYVAHAALELERVSGSISERVTEASKHGVRREDILRTLNQLQEVAALWDAYEQRLGALTDERHRRLKRPRREQR